MTDILSRGLDTIRLAQTLASPGFTLAMKALSFIGTQEFYIAFLPLVYWCLSRRKGVRLGVVVILSGFFNLWLKALVMEPRPYMNDSSLMLDSEDTYAFPSGHAQGTGVFWGMTALLFPRVLFTVAAFLLPLAVGFSRVYLGVHYPTDVFAGWALALVFLAVFRFAGEPIGAFFKSLERRFKIILLALVSFAMNQLLPGDTSMAGLFLGAGVGFVIASEDLRFSSGGSAGTRILRYGIGMATTLALYLAPKYLVGDAFPAQENLIRFLRYAVVGAWISLGAPWLFLSLGLATRED